MLEWMTKEHGTAIVRGVSPAINDCELTFVGREAIDIGRARAQHRAYADALRSLGLKIVELESDPQLPDSVFVEDCAVVLDDLAVITRPGAESRRAETVSVRAAIRDLGLSTIDIEPPGTIDGGDVMRIGRRLFVGVSTRTNAAGFGQLREIAASVGIKAEPVEVGQSLHLKTAVTALDAETVVINPAWIEPSVLVGFRQIAVPPDEPFAANTLTVSNTVLVSAKWPRTASLIANAGYSVRALDISELEKAEAGLTCLSLILR